MNRFDVKRNLVESVVHKKKSIVGRCDSLLGKDGEVVVMMLLYDLVKGTVDWASAVRAMDEHC